MEPILDFITVTVIAFICGIVFFIVDFYNESKTKEFNDHTASIIAGISVSYFFLVVLPEISENIPEYPLHLRLLEYLFVLVGFTFIHVSEKLILQKVDQKAQVKTKQLIRMEKSLDMVEQNISELIKRELGDQDLDDYALKDLARILSDLIEQEESLKEQDTNLKTKIQTHINEDLDRIHLWTNFLYHFLVGLILFNLFFIELFPAILFFLFAFFKAVISKTSNDIILFPDAELHDELRHPKPLIILFSSATLFGVVAGLIFWFVMPLSLEVLYILFSFVSGVILYIIVREVIPEKEKGNPLYFLLGAILFFIAVLIIRTLGVTLLVS